MKEIIYLYLERERELLPAHARLPFLTSLHDLNIGKHNNLSGSARTFDDAF